MAVNPDIQESFNNFTKSSNLPNDVHRELLNRISKIVGSNAIDQNKLRELRLRNSYNRLMEWSNEKEIVIGFSPSGNSSCDVIKNKYGPVGENLSLNELFYIISQIMYSILKTQNTLFDQTIMEDIVL